MTRNTRHVGIAEAKARLSDLVRQVEAGGGPVRIERHGRPVAVLARFQPDAEEAGAHWADALDGIGADIPDLAELLDEIIAARAQSLTRPVDLDV